MDETSTSQQGIPFDAAQFFKLLMEQVSRKDHPAGVYANNFSFEANVWDLRVLLGQLEQHEGKWVVDWHTAVRIPWLQVKLVAYFLRLHSAWHEQLNGPVSIPATVMPKEPEPPSGELAADPTATAWYETSKKIYEQTFG